jgi:hypothetical protein
MDDFEARIRRLYAAIGATVDENVSKFRPVVGAMGACTVMYQDWSGGLTQDQIAVLGTAAISHVANLRNHLFRWAAANGKLSEDVTSTVRCSFSLQVILDLANNEKHGYPPRDGGQSGRRPHVAEWMRVMQLSTGGTAQSSAMVVLLPSGPQVTTTGGGSAAVVVTGRVVDDQGAELGDLRTLLEEAARTWEGLLVEFGIHV